MNATLPRKINEGWITKRREILGMTVAVLADGSPNPSKAELAAEIAEAEAELARRREFEGWVKSELGLILNRYPLRVRGETFDPGRVFMQKDPATGRVEYLTELAAWEKYLATQPGPA
jgi:hypothetical protein